MRLFSYNNIKESSQLLKVTQKRTRKSVDIFLSNDLIKIRPSHKIRSKQRDHSQFFYKDYLNYIMFKRYQNFASGLHGVWGLPGR